VSNNSTLVTHSFALALNCSLFCEYITDASAFVASCHSRRDFKNGDKTQKRTPTHLQAGIAQQLLNIPQYILHLHVCRSGLDWKRTYLRCLLHILYNEYHIYVYSNTPKGLRMNDVYYHCLWAPFCVHADQQMAYLSFWRHIGMENLQHTEGGGDQRWGGKCATKRGDIWHARFQCNSNAPSAHFGFNDACKVVGYVMQVNVNTPSSNIHCGLWKG